MNLPAPLNRTVSDHGSGWRLIAADAVTEAAERRNRVLAHPDLAQHLCEHPMKLSEPARWNGYIPPESCQGQRNDSPYRAQIMRVLHAVAEREAEAM